MSAPMVEALAAAHWLGAEIAVSNHDVGPNLRSAAEAGGTRPGCRWTSGSPRGSV